MLAAVAIALALTSCGGGSGSSAATESSAAAAPTTPQKSQSATARAKPERATCSPKLGTFVDAMEGLRRGLEVGLSYEQYAGEVESIQGLYERIPIAKLSLACLAKAGTPSERAFDRYVGAANTWNACAAKPECGSAQIEAPLQKEWRVAAHLLGEAKRGLG